MWSDLKNKFMIYGDKILIGRVRYHKELLPVDIDYSIVHGGGEFRLDKEAKEIVVWGSSLILGILIGNWLLQLISQRSLRVISSCLGVQREVGMEGDPG